MYPWGEVEPLFAEAKEWHGLRRIRLRRLRRLRRVNSEVLMTTAGQNLKRLLAKQGWERRPLASGAALALVNPLGCVTVDVLVGCRVSAFQPVKGQHSLGHSDRHQADVHSGQAAISLDFFTRLERL